jgi:hypothetical protein
MAFSFNISKLVSMNDLFMYGYNSHDCHVMMMIFLAIAVQVIKSVHVKVIITRLCYFFNTVSQKMIGHKELDDLRAYMIETMCMLEMCFSPSFFDMQQYLMIHLVDQIHTSSPLYLYSMFPYERYLADLKSYVRNRAHPKGSIMEGYTTEEVIECCTDYVKDVKRIGLSIPLYEGRRRGRMCQKSFVDRNYNLVRHISVYYNNSRLLHRITRLSELHRDNIGHTEAWIMKEHQRVFITWLMDKEIHTEDMTMKMSSSRPSCCVTSWQTYDINGYIYYTKEKDKKSVAQNSDIHIEAIDPQGLKTTYYGYIQDIWELDYSLRIRIPIFR